MMIGAVPYNYKARFIYGEETRCALVSFRGKVEFIGPFADKSRALDAAKIWFRARGWNGGELRLR